MIYNESTLFPQQDERRTPMMLVLLISAPLTLLFAVANLVYLPGRTDARIALLLMLGLILAFTGVIVSTSYLGFAS